MAESEIPWLWCSMPQHVSVGLMYVSSLVLHVLSGAGGFLVFKDNHPLLFLSISLTALAEPNICSVNPSTETTFCLSSLVSSAYLLDAIDGSGSPPSNFQDGMARALKTNTITITMAWLQFRGSDLWRLVRSL